MRVLLDVSAVPAEPVGAGVYTLELARGLSARREVSLILLTRRRDEGRWATIAPGSTVVAAVPPSRPARLAWEQLLAPGLARRLAVDLWHGPHYTMPIRLTVPAVVTVHDLTFFDHPEWHERSKVEYFRRMIVASTARANGVVCVSEFTESRLHAHTDPVGIVTVIPHGVDHDRFAPSAHGDTSDDLAALARLGITTPYIGFLSTIEPRKNVGGLVRAFARLAPRHRQLQLVLAGGRGWGSDVVQREIEQSGVAAKIVRPGRIDDAIVPAFYRHAAVIAYPSFEEGFGLPALEAMACGAPLVTSRGSALEEVVDGAALTVDPEDTDAIAAAMERALDPACAQDLRTRGPERARRFRWDDTVDAHVALYQKLALGTRR